MPVSVFFFLFCSFALFLFSIKPVCLFIFILNHHRSATFTSSSTSIQISYHHDDSNMWHIANNRYNSIALVCVAFCVTVTRTSESESGIKIKNREKEKERTAHLNSKLWIWSLKLIKNERKKERGGGGIDWSDWKLKRARGVCESVCVCGTKTKNNKRTYTYALEKTKPAHHFSTNTNTWMSFSTVLWQYYQ
jgi:hypothetical protein